MRGLRDAGQAFALLEERGILTLAALAEAVAGRAIRGSWWGHPKGKLIYAIASELEDRDDVLACKLAGKATFVHRALWPALLRVVTDVAWRRATLRALPPAAARLARRVTQPVRIERTTLAPRERAALEKSCILHVSSEHTETGAHASIVRSWTSWAPASELRTARKLGLDEARTSLRMRGLELPAAPSPKRRPNV